MRTLTAFSFYLSALGCGVALINQISSYSMILGGIALISHLAFTLIDVSK